MIYIVLTTGIRRQDAGYRAPRAPLLPYGDRAGDFHGVLTPDKPVS